MAGDCETARGFGATSHLRMSTDRRRRSQFAAAVTSLVALHLRFHTYKMGWTDSAVRRYVRDAGDQLAELNVLTRCDCTTRDARKAATLAKRIDELEARIAELEGKMRELEARLAAVSQSGDYMETKRVGLEHAEVEESLKKLYSEWTEKEAQP